MADVLSEEEAVPPDKHEEGGPVSDDAQDKVGLVVADVCGEDEPAPATLY